MITYVLKFVACSGLLLAAYYLFLANERLYQFNRFYLLFSLAFALAVPLVTFKVAPVTVPAFEQKDLKQTVLAIPEKPENLQNKTDGNQTEEVVVQPTVSAVTQTALTKVNIPIYRQTFIERLCAIAPIALLCVYFAGLLIMLSRFVGNGYRIGRRIRASVMETVGHVKLVLLPGQVTPHSFFNYVFLNKAEYDTGLIEQEIICHEQAHVRQWHSLDVLFVELVQALCWFNPFIPLYRRAIQLNHEFLADEAVIKRFNNTPAYLHLLLAKSNLQSGLSLTSQFNYSVTKKRFVMITKYTSAKIALLKQLAIIPVIATLLIFFGNKAPAQDAPVVRKINGISEAPPIAGDKPGKQYTVNGLIHGAGSEMVYMFHSDRPSIKIKRDSVKADHGRFIFTGQLNATGPVLIGIRFRDSKGKKSGIALQGPFILDGGTLNLVSGEGPLQKSWYNVRYASEKTYAWGTPGQDEYNIFRHKANPVYKVMNDITGKRYNIKKNDTRQLDMLDKASRQCDSQINQIVTAQVKRYPSSVVSAYIVKSALLSPTYETIKPLYGLFTPDVKNSTYGKQILEEMQASAGTAPGRPAPGFNLPDRDNKLVSLQAYKGKYTLVDFWASWCGPCRLENPNLIKAYANFKKSGFEIVSISVDDNKNSWLGAIKEDGLPWMQLQAPKSQVIKAYGVTAIPMNFLLDKDGKIIASNLRGGELQKKLAEIIPAN